MILEVNNEKIECPICWEEMDTATFQRIYNAEDIVDPVKVFSLLTNTHYDAIMEDRSEELELTLYQVTSFVYTQAQAFRESPVPVVMRIGERIIMIPKNLESLTIGQNMHIRKAMSEAKNLESLISLACAVYLQPLIDNDKFNFERAKEVEKSILALSIYETFPIGFFFLKKLNESGRNGLRLWLHRIRMRIKNFLRLPKLPTFHVLTLSMICLSLIHTPKPTASFQDSYSLNPSMKSCLSYTSGKNRKNINPDLPPSINS